MSSVLRFIGIMNAAVWLGAAVFFTCAADPVFFSGDMKRLLGPVNFPYYSGAVAQLVLRRYTEVSTLCILITFAHLLGQRLYTGRSIRRGALVLAGGLLALVLVTGYGVNPALEARLEKLHAKNTPAERESAANSFQSLRLVSQLLNLAIIGGLVGYLAQLTNLSEATRFVSSVKFRD